MTVENSQNSRAEGLRFLTGKLGSTRRVIAGDIVLVQGDPFTHFLDPNGGTYVVRLPVLSTGDDFRVVTNVGTSGTLTVANSAGTSLATLAIGQTAICFGSGSEWAILRGWRDLSVFGPAGTGHSVGLVPDPGAVAGLARFLMDDGTWTSVTTAGIVDAYKQIYDGTNTAIASGLSQLRLRSSDSSVSAVATNNDATYGDVVNFTVDPTHVNHDLLQNYVADKHVAHSGVTLTAGNGLSGGGDISASRTFDLDLSDLTVDTPVLGDYLGFYDISGSDTNRATFTTLNGILVHNSLSGYVADEHVAHSGVSVIAGTGLSGGGTIAASRTLNIDLNGLTADTLATGDFFMFYDISESDLNKVSLANLNSSLDHNSLANYSANQHVDHTTVSITAGTGLTGGGTIAATRTLSVSTNAIDNTLIRQGVARSVIGVTGNATSNVADIQGTTDQVLRVNGAGTALAFGAIDLSKAAAATGVIQAASFPAMTGDVTSSAGALATTIAANVVTYAKFQQVAASSLVGNATGSLANATGITLGTTLAFSGSALQTAALTGDVTASANSFATTIAANAVTNAKMATMATLTVKANITAGSAVPTDVAGSALLDALFGSTRGMVLRRGVSTWNALALGSNTYVLSSDGTDVVWAAPTGGGGSGTETFALHQGIGGL